MRVNPEKYNFARIDYNSIDLDKNKASKNMKNLMMGALVPPNNNFADKNRNEFRNRFNNAFKTNIVKALDGTSEKSKAVNLFSNAFKAKYDQKNFGGAMQKNEDLQKENIPEAAETGKFNLFEKLGELRQLKVPES